MFMLSIGGNGRITPAYAGKSGMSTSHLSHKRDHPRLCGEKGRVAAGVVAVSGSPPPMRGKVVDFNHVIAENRITPAYAGKSFDMC